MSIEYVLMIFYDIPNKNINERKKYTKFRKYLKNNGFYQMQESVYLRKYKNKNKIDQIIIELKILSPIGSNIRALILTENIFYHMKIISGELSFNEKILNKTTKLIEL